ncbi:gamma-glutamyltransferase family protein [Streptomyces sp. TS71-3]|uniref:gamma-glutamyltransferase family protein n=1 Tax=Streptomyces sp. TS71-3 TaxID=2733862 RepID=UPI001B06810C|nr:gamma-glutamyltransferase [Streptomyces sp. TS71-3]GHJ39327.1 gamma-glutamyltranspeptidase [Streptomyces sp. TS71-3]
MARTFGAIATPHHLASDAGEQAFRAGGNALDAALAAATVLTVVYPHNTALGGDLVALVRDPRGTIVCVNATGTAPAARDAAKLRGKHGDRLPAKGPDTITVPGAVRGWQEIRRLGAALEWADQFQAAVAHAADGVPVAPSLAAALTAGRDMLVKDPGARQVFAPRGDVLAEGRPLVQPRLAQTLREIASNGPDELYAGAVGAALAAGLQAAGCPLTVDDLTAYAARTTSAISAPFAGLRVHTSPPNTQGFALLRTLRALAELGLDASVSDLPAGVLARLFLDGTHVRDTLLADPDSATADVLEHGFDDLVRDLRSRAPRPAAAVVPPPAPSGDTVGVAAADSSGYAVSLIQSVYGSFGSAVLEPATGILMQNRGTGFSLDPASPNVIRPGKRPKHTLMPVLVTEGERVRWINATMGGHGQPQIHAQVLAQLLDGRSPAEAVSAPRFVVGARQPGDTADTVHHEADLSPAAVAELAADGFPVREVPVHTEFLGHTNVVCVGADGTLTAGSDPRSDGRAAVVALPGGPATPLPGTAPDALPDTAPDGSEPPAVR